MAFDENKYKTIFESRYGAGSFEAGLSQARQIGASKVQADLAMDALKKARQEALKKSEKKTYQDAIGYWNDPINKESLKKDGAYRRANDILNDPIRQAEIKDQGFNVSDYIDGMYYAASDGKIRSQREYGQHQKSTKTQSKSEQKTQDEEYKSKYGMDYNSYWEYQKSLPTTKETQKKKEKDYLPAVANKSTKKKSGTSLWDDLKATGKMAYQGFNPFDDVSMKEAFGEYTQRDTSKAFNEIARGSNRAVDSASFGAMSNLDKKINDRQPYYNSQRKFGEGGGTDMLTSGLGYLVPGVGSYKALNATKLGTGLTNFGAKGLSQRLTSEAAKGAITGAGLAGAEVGVREGLNPQDYTAKQNLGYIGFGAAAGAVADPLLYGLGKGVQNGLSRFAKGDVPTYTGQPSPNVLDQLTPNNASNVQNSNGLYDQLIVGAKQPKFEVPLENRVKTNPIASEYNREFQEAVEQQYQYLKNSMGKGVEYGSTGGGGLGNFKEVNGGFRVSNNPQWYQDFYRQNGRKPTNAELQELAEQHVREGFQDEVGTLPAWQPTKVQEIEDQLLEVRSMIDEMPEQEEALRPILQALEEELEGAKGEINQALNVQPSVTPQKKTTTLRAGRDFEPIAAGIEEEPELAQVAEELLDSQRQASGDLDSFRSRVNREPVKKKSDLLPNLRTQFIDDVAPLEALEKNVAGKIGSAENSLYKQARLFKGSPERANLVVREQLQPIFKNLQDNKLSTKDLGDYALAVHAKDVNEKGINSGFTNAEIKDVIDKLGTPQMEAARKQLLTVNNNILNTLKEGGILNETQIQGMREKWPNYVSLFRAFDDDKIGFANGMSNALANASSPIKKLQGSNREVIDPLESVVKNIFKATNTVDRNKVASQIGKLAEKDTEGAFIRKIEGKEDVSRLNVVSVMEDGKKVKYEVPTEVYKTMMNLDKESSNTLIKILQKPASMLRAGATLTPEFSLRNPLRDVPNAFVVSESGFNPVIDFPIGLWQSIWKGRTIKIGNKEFKTAGDLYKQFIKENGGYGNIISMDRELHRQTLEKALTEVNTTYVDVLDPKTYKTLLKQYGNPLNALRKIADVSETATKVGEFRAALKKGVTPQEAAYRARDIMDFARAGVSVREANKVVAFLNANIQGKSKLWRAFQNDKKGFLGRASAAVTIPTIGAIVAQNTLANDKQKEIINDAPQWLKDSFWLLPIPGTNQIARIPKPFDLAFPFSNTLERAFDYVAKHDKEAFDGYIKQGFSQASIPVMLTGMAPIVEGMANYSFFRQGPVIPKREENVNFPDQYDVNTTETAKFIGKGISKLTGGQGAFKNFGSPRVIDNTIQGFTGGLGTYATSVIDIFAKGGDGEPVRPSKNIDQMPLTRAFLVNQSSGGESMEKIYTMKEQLTKARGSAKQNQEPFTDEGKYQAVNNVTKSLSDVNKLVRMIENDPNLSAKEKRSRLDSLINQRNTIARQAMENLRSME
jgi:hypothetical protein